MSEFKSLDGREYVVVTYLRDLVLKTYGRTPRISRSYRVVCPRCLERNVGKGEPGYNHRNLSISNDMTIGHCYRCDGVFLDASRYLTQEVDKPQIDLDLGHIDSEFEVNKVNLDILNTSVPLESDMKALSYISNRNKYLVPSDYYLMYKPNKIFIPFYYNGELIYYQIRYIEPFNPNMKYFSPPVDNKPIYIPLSKGKYFWDIAAPTILCEGAFTAIALRCIVGDEYNVVSLLGKTITEYQAKMLENIGISDVYIMMDSTDLSYNVKRLRYSFLKNSTIIESDGSDAEELLKAYGINICLNYINKYKIKIPNVSLSKKVTMANELFEPFVLKGIK